MALLRAKYTGLDGEVGGEREEPRPPPFAEGGVLGEERGTLSAEFRAGITNARWREEKKKVKIDHLEDGIYFSGTGNSLSQMRVFLSIRSRKVPVSSHPYWKITCHGELSAAVKCPLPLQ